MATRVAAAPDNAGARGRGSFKSSLRMTAAGKTSHDMILRFWGVRGSVPTPGPQTVRYGGNTLCVELRCGPHLVILDAGSGLRPFGRALVDAGAPVDADILLSHTHFDHICGLPFFMPLYDPRSRFRIWGGHLTPPHGIAEALMRSWTAPLMPDLNKAFRANITISDFASGDELLLHPGLRARTVTLRHPGNAVGYRVTWGKRSVCYITDTEHPPDGLDTALLQFVSGADIMIYDASFTDQEYPAYVGWGHSTWQVGARLAEAASVGQLILFHHDPGHDDAAMDTIAGAVAERLPGSLVASEGMVLEVVDR
jgi:phosphoribosyl 1,2-cyclic phosphodiesterase